MHYGSPTKKLADEVLLRCSILEQLHSDQEVQFESQLMGKVCRLLHINQTRITPNHPQCNELVELHRILCNILATYASDHPPYWEKHIRYAWFIIQCPFINRPYNFYLMFSQHARLLIDTMHGAGEHDEAQSPCEYQYTEETPDNSIFLSERTVGKYTLAP